MESILLPSDYYLDDTVFDSFLPEKLRKISKIHWTPLAISKKAASFLAPVSGSKILDIGSGVGKFCITAAHFFPDSEFHGVEQREDLHTIALQAQQRSGANNVQFINGNFTQLNLDIYDSIYFYNSFAENLIDVGRIDNSVDYSQVCILIIPIICAGYLIISRPGHAWLLIMDMNMKFL